MSKLSLIQGLSALLLLAAFAAHVNLKTRAVALPPVSDGSVGVNGFFSVDKAQRGRTFQAAVVLDIPGGLHVNANRPLGKYAVPTTVKVDAPRGFKVGPVGYPRGRARSFEFSDERLAVYEGRTPLRFNVTVPSDFPVGVTRIRVVVRYQSCSDAVCYPPRSSDITLPITVVGTETPARRINAQLFGGGRGRRG